MQLSPFTLDVLKNYAGINQGILIREGNQLRTVSVMKTVFSVANIPDTFDREFAIYDLTEFLSTLSLFESPDLILKDDHLQIVSGRTKIKYHYSSPEVITAPPNKELKLPSVDLEFELPDLKQLHKASSVMKLDEVCFTKDDEGKLVVKLVNSSNGLGNEFSVEVRDTEVETSLDQFQIHLFTSNLKFLSGTYLVRVSKSGMAQFIEEDQGIEYVVSLLTNSKFT